MNLLHKCAITSWNSVSKILPVSHTSVRTVGNWTSNISSYFNSGGLSSVITVRRRLKERWPNHAWKWKGGKKYFGFTYYPRYPDQVDPQWERSSLFMIKRKKRYKGCPFWEKRILKSLGLDGKVSDIAIVMNSEHVNKELWKIKHLITITPITFPDGIPEEKDLSNCRLFENGELRFGRSLAIDPKRLEATETFQKSIDVIDKPTIQHHTRQRWLNMFHADVNY